MTARLATWSGMGPQHEWRRRHQHSKLYYAGCSYWLPASAQPAGSPARGSENVKLNSGELAASILARSSRSSKREPILYKPEIRIYPVARSPDAKGALSHITGLIQEFRANVTLTDPAFGFLVSPSRSGTFLLGGNSVPNQKWLGGRYEWRKRE